jgi:hypothetical protein
MCHFTAFLKQPSGISGRSHGQCRNGGVRLAASGLRFIANSVHPLGLRRQRLLVQSTAMRLVIYWKSAQLLAGGEGCEIYIATHYFTVHRVWSPECNNASHKRLCAQVLRARVPSPLNNNLER